jgi:hypothetical protein
MTMTFDFGQAARCHWDDAVLLHEGARLRNADQLYGLSAECALKAILVDGGLAKTTSAGDIERSDAAKTHISRLWGEFQARMERRSSRLPLGDNPFGDWEVAQRYAADADVPREDVVSLHRAGADACRRALEQWALSNGMPS